MKSGNLNFLESSGPLQACNGTALPLQVVKIYKVFFNYVLNSPCYRREVVRSVLCHIRHFKDRGSRISTVRAQNAMSICPLVRCRRTGPYWQWAQCGDWSCRQWGPHVRRQSQCMQFRWSGETSPRWINIPANCSKGIHLPRTARQPVLKDSI